MRPLLVLLTLWASLTIGLWTATQYEATHVPTEIKGAPWTMVAGYAIYKPHAMLGWWWHVDQRTREVMWWGAWILYGSCVVGILAASLLRHEGDGKGVRWPDD